MKQFNVALIGQGRSGRDIHGLHLHKDNRFKVCAVVDKLENRRLQASQEWNCPVFADYEDLFQLENLDLVVNASYSHQHASISLDLLEHGLHVISEKPGAAKAEQVRQMNRKAVENKRMLAFFQQSRLAPYYQQIKAVIDSGKLGRIVQISIRFNGYARRWDWQCLREYAGGSLYNTGPHPLDQALDLLGFETDALDVLCQMDRANTFGDAEDYVKIILRSPGNPLIDLEISSCDAYTGPLYQVQGTRGGLKAQMTQIDWRYFRLEEAPLQTLIREPLQNEAGLPLYCKEDLTWYEESWSTKDANVFSGAVYRFYDNIYAHLTEQAPLLVTAEQVEKQIAVIERCHQQNQ